jgi:hypothetical protein
MFVRLTKKLADVVNGLDISHCNEGDVIDVPAHHAQMLMSEGWAEEVSPDVTPSCAPVWKPRERAVAAERPMRRRPAHESDDDELISRLRLGVNAAWQKDLGGDPEPAT